MLRKVFAPTYSIALLLLIVTLNVSSQNSPIGIFEGRSDIGQATNRGSVFYDTENDTYELSNIATNSASNNKLLYYVWKRLKGDFIIYAEFYNSKNDTTSSSNLGCMIRASLDTNSANLKTSFSPGGLTSITYKNSTDSNTTKIQSAVKDANVLQIEKRDSTFIIRVAKFGEPFTWEEIIHFEVADEVYIGLFINADNKNHSKGICRNFRITIPVPRALAAFRTDIASNLEFLNIESEHRKIILTDSNSIHSPIWKKDGRTVIYGKQGLLYTYDLEKKTATPIKTGQLRNNSNDHILSPDEKRIAFCVPDREKGGAVLYTVMLTGEELRLVHDKAPSYPHGWSQDGKYLLFSGSRKNEFEIYKIPFNGGREQSITNSLGMDDCPEYSPDGKSIYFVSNRSGNMCIWKMKDDGSQQEMLTTGEFHDWFPHISPDGKWLVFLSYSRQDATSSGHPSYRNVYLRIMPATGGEPKVIAYFYGGQGSINSPCWSPDSKTISFASYSDTQY